MEHDEDRNAFAFIVGLAMGTLVGAGVALLIAPHSGQRTRRKLVRAAEDLGDTTRDRIEDAGDDARRRARKAVRAAERRGDRVRRGLRRATPGVDD